MHTKKINNMQRALKLSDQAEEPSQIRTRNTRVIQMNSHARSVDRPRISTLVTLIVLTAWVAVSLVYDYLFLKEIISSSFIIACLLFLSRSNQSTRKIISN